MNIKIHNILLFTDAARCVQAEGWEDIEEIMEQIENRRTPHCSESVGHNYGFKIYFLLHLKAFQNENILYSLYYNIFFHIKK